MVSTVPYTAAELTKSAEDIKHSLAYYSEGMWHNEEELAGFYLFYVPLFRNTLVMEFMLDQSVSQVIPYLFASPHRKSVILLRTTMNDPLKMRRTNDVSLVCAFLVGELSHTGCRL
jgi:hypothetical protein